MKRIKEFVEGNLDEIKVNKFVIFENAKGFRYGMCKVWVDECKYADMIVNELNGKLLKVKVVNINYWAENNDKNKNNNGGENRRNKNNKKKGNNRNNGRNRRNYGLKTILIRMEMMIMTMPMGMLKYQRDWLICGMSIELNFVFLIVSLSWKHMFASNKYKLNRFHE